MKTQQLSPALDLVLTADKRIATTYAKAIMKADGQVQQAERTFCAGFATNHQGQEPKAIKAGFGKLRASKVFEHLAKQSVDNLSSMAQFIAALPEDAQDALFAADNFRKAYLEKRRPVAASTPAGDTEVPDGIESPASGRENAVPEPASEPETFDEACNRIAVDLNSVVESIANVLSAHPAHVGGSVLEMLARDIGKAVEKAAHARMQVLNKKAA